MKRWLLLIILCLSICQINAEKRALLVGISEYPQGSGWCTLSSDNDLALLDSVLKGRMPSVMLSDGKATKTGIINALSRLASQAGIGDTILIHFSGHGQQMWSIDVDEKDMLDEAFIPYDAMKDSTEAYSGQHHLRDNELGECINSIRKRIGDKGLVIVSIDACHSGSIDKGEDKRNAVIRGTFDIFGSLRASADRARYDQPDDTSIIEKGDMSDVIYLSACGQHEINREIVEGGKGYGSLSYSLAQALISPGLAEKVSFIDAIYFNMSKYQPLQNPRVRASFAYKYIREEDDTLPPSQHMVKTDENNTVPIVIISVILLSLLAWFIWKRKKI